MPQFTSSGLPARCAFAEAEPATTGGAVYAYAITVQASDIDFMGHANNARYLEWVQSAVIAHWQALADAPAVAAHVWVALKHEITYRKPAFLNDRIVATAVLEQVRRESAFYDTVIRRGSEVLAHVKPRWCCLDATTLRPTRVGGDIVRNFLSLGPEQAHIDGRLA
ncbi:acyl-CoA thioesterase [Sphingobium yanoikuyae]|uniref:acyl-CoA thioesterase n=1 Tax=Sphingobium yanoikuyae TaxID=13690 RepID=UPI00241D6512|nr:thioesterase family protein [Sphingobium yanoikuyae]